MKGYAQIAKNIRKFRIENELTQEELAEKLNMSVMTIRRYEAGTRTPTWRTLQDMAMIFDISPHRFIINDDDYESVKESLANDLSRKDNKIMRAMQLYESVQNDMKLRIIHNVYESLNEKGKDMAFENILNVAKIPECTKENEDS